ncbi:hypothetical protein SSBR45G_32360 [Bradyrhizobium sp. SSBR45G]|nr:hypothetical protein SSBR45G_32360 [Bradyrhizobium sp. SSBR45G]GLH86110.1 hypothetical protein SSBR45R_35700 [Bradyrhizobium sp. SSBR45R]
MVLFWASAALAADGPVSQYADDIALTKATISSLAAKDFASVRNKLDPTLGQISNEKLDQMSNVMGASEPISGETISSTGAHNFQTGDGSSRVILEYGLTGKWVVVDAVVKTQGASKRFIGLYLTVNTLPLRELNAFHLLGKGPIQYLFLSAWIAVIGLTGLAIAAAFRRHSGWRRWALIVVMPLGLTPTLAMNWSTAQTWVMEATSNPAGNVVPVVAFRWPMALFGYAATGAPFLYISAPLIAFGYLIWSWSSSRRRPSLADQFD